MVNENGCRRFEGKVIVITGGAMGLGKAAAEALRKGEELRRRWDLDGADREFREAASLNPSSLEAKIGQARIARVRIQYSRAIEVLKKAEVEHPSSPEVFDEFGSIYLAAEESSTVVGKPVHVVRRELRLAQAWLRSEMAADVHS